MDQASGGWVGDRLLRAFGDEILRMNRRRNVAFAGAVLDGSAFKILWLLVETGPQTLRDLAEELQLEQSTINRQVNAAIRHGHVERYQVEGQASRRLRPTEAGSAAYQHDGRIRAGVLVEALHELGQDRAVGLVEELRALNDAMDTARERAQSQHDEDGTR